jgi:hypothetical protein
MSASINVPDVSKVRRPDEIIALAEQLRQINAPQAIKPLAQLSRRAPGWLKIVLGFIATGLISLIGCVLVAGLVVIGAAWVFSALNAFVQTFYPDLPAVWWGLGLLWLGAWLWFDERLRQALRKDGRFDLKLDQLSHRWQSAFKPFYLLSAGLRLIFNVIFLMCRLALPLAALSAIMTAGLKARADASLRDPITYGLLAGTALLLLGLFALGDWPRRNSAAGVSLRLLLALLLALAAGWLAFTFSPASREAVGLSVAGVAFLLFAGQLLRKRSDESTGSWAHSERAAQRALRLNDRQWRFLKALLFLLTMLGLGVVVLTFAQNWASLRRGVPPPVTQILQSLYLSARISTPGEYRNWEPWWAGLVIGGSVLILGLVYSTHLSIALSKLLIVPFYSLYRALYHLALRTRARTAVRAALRFHRQRNQQLISGRGEQAVCHTHLARFEERSEMLAYGRALPGRRVQYWWCRACQSDAQACTGVRLMRGVFDQTMCESVRQDGDLLLVNLLKRLDGQNEPMPLNLDEIEIGKVDDQHDIEMFITRYRAYSEPIAIPPLKQIRLRIRPEANLEPNIDRMIHSNLKQ